MDQVMDKGHGRRTFARSHIQAQEQLGLWVNREPHPYMLESATHVRIQLIELKDRRLPVLTTLVMEPLTVPTGSFPWKKPSVSMVVPALFGFSSKTTGSPGSDVPSPSMS